MFDHLFDGGRVLQVASSCEALSDLSEYYRIMCSAVSPELTARILRSQSSVVSVAKTTHSDCDDDLDDLDVVVEQNSDKPQLHLNPEKALCPKAQSALRTLSVFLNPKAFKNFQLIAQAQEAVLSQDKLCMCFSFCFASWKFQSNIVLFIS